MKANVVALVAFLAMFGPPNSAIALSSVKEEALILWKAQTIAGFRTAMEGTNVLRPPARHQLTEGSAKSKNVTCHCEFGDAGRPETNLSSYADTKNRIRCKAGTLDASEAGVPRDAECLDNEYGYCYVAHCAKVKCLCYKSFNSGSQIGV
ncbi:hypothetical protein GPALN_006063 [Globodera pallida]|nr:hypothetical protein GPALN_006063 [Globodera pallida]